MWSNGRRFLCSSTLSTSELEVPRVVKNSLSVNNLYWNCYYERLWNDLQYTSYEQVTLIVVPVTGLVHTWNTLLLESNDCVDASAARGVILVRLWKQCYKTQFSSKMKLSTYSSDKKNTYKPIWIKNSIMICCTFISSGRIKTWR